MRCAPRASQRVAVRFYFSFGSFSPDPASLAGRFMSASPAQATEMFRRLEMMRRAIRDIAVFYSITSSAVATRADGTLRPSAFAVFKFSASANFVGN